MNYETRPNNIDRDLCDDFADNHDIESKKGDFVYFFDECDDDGDMIDDWYGWKQLTLQGSGSNPYSFVLKIDNVTIETNNLDNDVRLV